MSWIRHHPLIVFFTIAFGITWGFILAYWLIVSGSDRDAGMLIKGLSYVAVWGPSLAGFIMAAIVGGGGAAWRLLSRLWAWPGSAWWWALAILLPLAIEGLAAAFSAYASRYSIVQVGPDSWSRVGIFLAVTILSGPLGEEFGWRGFALPRLAESIGPKRAAMLLAAVWALWHVPVFIVPDLQDLVFPTGITVWSLSLLLLGAGIIIAWLTFRAEGALGPAVLFHLGLLCVLMFVKQDPPPSLVWTGSVLYFLLGLGLLVFSPSLGWKARSG